MSIVNILAILQNHCHIPPGSIYRGNSGKELKIDYVVDDTLPIGQRPPIKEKLKEAKTDGTVTFVKPGETLKTSAELRKEGKLESKPPKEKPPKVEGSKK